MTSHELLLERAERAYRGHANRYSRPQREVAGGYFHRGIFVLESHSGVLARFQLTTKGTLNRIADR